MIVAYRDFYSDVKMNKGGNTSKSSFGGTAFLFLGIKGVKKYEKVFKFISGDEFSFQS